MKQIKQLKPRQHCQPSSPGVTHDRAMFLDYLQALFQLGDSMLSPKSRDAFQQALGVAKQRLDTNPNPVQALDHGSKPMKFRLLIIY